MHLALLPEFDLVIIGAGAAGLLAGIRSAELGVRTLLLEKNRKPGVKILMSGGTRCNLTHDTDERGIISAFGRNGRFLHSALAAFSPRDVVQFFNREGLETKVESTGKVFPVSDRALDVQRTLLKRLRSAGCELRLDSPVQTVETLEDGSFQVVSESSNITSRFVLVTTGGMSFPGCGTTGDGYPWAKACGHEIIAPRPALTPLKSNEAWVRELSGITLPDVDAMVIDQTVVSSVADLARPKLIRRALAHDRGSFLFTHRGLSGPVPMNLSKAVTAPRTDGPFWMLLDFLPDSSDQQTLDHIRSATRNAGKQTIESFLIDMLPRRVIRQLLSGIDLRSDIRCAELSKKNAASLSQALKRTLIPLSGTMGFAKAEVTTGGVSLAQVHSSTMESRLKPGLYFAGEILDLDGPIGGYNFQSAFSTGWLAATSVARAVGRGGEG